MTRVVFAVIALFLAILSCSVPSNAQVIFDAKGTADVFTNAPGGTPVDFTNLTIGSASNRALVVFVLYASGSGAQSFTVTWDNGGTNQALTLIGSELAFNTNSSFISMWGLVNPTPGNKTLRVTTTAAMSPLYVDAMSVSGADQRGGANTFANFNSNTGTTTSSNVSITSSAGSLVAAHHGVQGSGGDNVNSVNNTQIYIDNTGANLRAGANYASGASSVSMTATFAAPPTSGAWGAVGVSINAVYRGLLLGWYR